MRLINEQTYLLSAVVLYIESEAAAQLSQGEININISKLR